VSRRGSRERNRHWRIETGPPLAYIRVCGDTISRLRVELALSLGLGHLADCEPKNSA
jgi:hypothetical protein